MAAKAGGESKGSGGGEFDFPAGRTNRDFLVQAWLAIEWFKGLTKVGDLRPAIKAFLKKGVTRLGSEYYSEVKKVIRASKALKSKIDGILTGVPNPSKAARLLNNMEMRNMTKEIIKKLNTVDFFKLVSNIITPLREALYVTKFEFEDVETGVKVTATLNGTVRTVTMSPRHFISFYNQIYTWSFEQKTKELVNNELIKIYGQRRREATKSVFWLQNISQGIGGGLHVLLRKSVYGTVLKAIMELVGLELVPLLDETLDFKSDNQYMIARKAIDVYLELKPKLTELDSPDVEQKMTDRIGEKTPEKRSAPKKWKSFDKSAQKYREAVKELTRLRALAVQRLRVEEFDRDYVDYLNKDKEFRAITKKIDEEFNKTSNILRSQHPDIYRAIQDSIQGSIPVAFLPPMKCKWWWLGKKDNDIYKIYVAGAIATVEGGDDDFEPTEFVVHEPQEPALYFRNPDEMPQYARMIYHLGAWTEWQKHSQMCDQKIVEERNKKARVVLKALGLPEGFILDDLKWEDLKFTENNEYKIITYLPREQQLAGGASRSSLESSFDLLRF